MAKNPYIILGVSKDATLDEVYERYKQERNKYEALRFEPGEVGADACIRLGEIDEAYDIISDEIKQRDSFANRNTVVNENNTKESETEVHIPEYNSYDELSKIEQASALIKDKNFEEAQRLLDDCQYRPAKWHYVQSAIFYQKGWKEDAFRQIDLACNMDPNNQVFKEAKKKMEESMKANTTDQQKSFYNENNGSSRSYRNAPGGSTGSSCGVCDVCCGLLCCDSCCECMGGDIIPCC